uniref:Small ribosomal subunit protein uS2c n=1 Tax=Sargassum horneri TaxID=74089 RepID=A0A141BSD4_9PHAE|nr:ribsomal protein S2 [Sargassum horneri]AKO62483.1 ribsomal protein S2 [Sargassum horneri]QJC59357.1 ribosomal protein S2 [Sargassum horneri]QNU09330.1 ribosomal protein S2 [Sargassum horneri]UVW81120.1 30S ribosomal protein S2 [Sargassum horneri]
MAKIELAQLLEAGVHFGHKAQRWNPKMFPYIYAERNGIHILDLIQTTEFLKRACDFSKKASSKNQTFLFVGTKRHTASLVASEAQKCGAFYINHRWLGGTLTNWVTIKERIERLNNLEEQEKLTSFKNLPKKEASYLKKELEKLKKYFNGVKGMKKLPDILIIIDQKREIIAIQEAISLNIPIISIIDTNCDPNLATIPIPGNDDSIRSIKYIIKNIADSICLGQQSYLKN